MGPGGQPGESAAQNQPEPPGYVEGAQPDIETDVACVVEDPPLVGKVGPQLLSEASSPRNSRHATDLSNGSVMIESIAQDLVDLDALDLPDLSTEDPDYLADPHGTWRELRARHWLVRSAFGTNVLPYTANHELSRSRHRLHPRPGNHADPFAAAACDAPSMYRMMRPSLSLHS